MQRKRHERYVRPSAFCKCSIGTAGTAVRVRLFERRTADWKAACDRPSRSRFSVAFLSPPASAELAPACFSCSPNVRFLSCENTEGVNEI
jgi:hypothetical protein